MTAGGMGVFLCAGIGHDYKVHQEFSSDCRRLYCPRCGQSWAMNDRVKVLVLWNQEFERFYQSEGHAIHLTPYEIADKNAKHALLRAGIIGAIVLVLILLIIFKVAS